MLEPKAFFKAAYKKTILWHFFCCFRHLQWPFQPPTMESQSCGVQSFLLVSWQFVVKRFPGCSGCCSHFASWNFVRCYGVQQTDVRCWIASKVHLLRHRRRHSRHSAAVHALEGYCCCHAFCSVGCSSVCCVRRLKSVKMNDGQRVHTKSVTKKRSVKRKPKC